MLTLSMQQRIRRHLAACDPLTKHVDGRRYALLKWRKGQRADQFDQWPGIELLGGGKTWLGIGDLPTYLGGGSLDLGD